MRIFCVSVLLSFCCAELAAQNQVGFFAGGQTSTASYAINSIKQKKDYKYGFQLGMNMKVPFEGNIYFNPAVFYSLKGYKVSFTQFAFPPDTNAIDNDVRLHTFEIAPMLQIDLGKNPSHCFIKFGPSLDFQLFGKEKFNRKNGGGPVDRNMKFGFTDYGHFAANFLAQFGYESSSGFMVFAQYSLGLASINNADNGPRIRHRVYGISIGHYLKNKKIIIDTRNRE